MGVVVAHRAVELGDERYGRNPAAGAHQTRGDVGHFLAQGGGSRRLAVGTGQHWQVGQLMRQVAQANDHPVKFGKKAASDSVLQHQRMRHIVDVFRGAAEMYELADAHHFGIARQTILQPVFHGFHVMIGAGLDGLDGFRVGNRETGNDTVQFGDRGAREHRAFADFCRLRERLEPLDFDANPVAYEAVFGEMDAQAFDFGCVASVKRRKCGKCGKGHVFG
jgi:hypothetical protein